MCEAHIFVHIEPLGVVVHFVGLQSDSHEPRCLVEFEFPLSYSLHSFSNLTHFACGKLPGDNSENHDGRGGKREVRKEKREGKKRK